MFGTKSRKYLEMFIHKDKAYFTDNGIAEQIRSVLRENPELHNVKVRVEFFAKRCAGCGRELTAPLCNEYRGKTYCGACKGDKTNYHEDPARRFQL